MTVNEITTSIAGILERENDFTFKRSLLTKINGWRSTIIRQALKENPTDRKFFTQQLFVEFEIYTELDGVTVCQDMSRSTKDIPKVLRAGSVVFDYFGSVDGYTPLGQFTAGTERYLRSQYQLDPRYDNRDSTVYLTSNRVKKLMAVAIWDDPEQVFMYNCTTGDCDFWNSEYPVAYDIAQRIIQSIITVDFRRPLPHENKEVQVNEER